MKPYAALTMFMKIEKSCPSSNVEARWAYCTQEKKTLFKQLQAQNPVSMKCAVPNWQVKTDERMIQIGADLMPYGHATHEGLSSLKQNDSSFLFLGQTIIPLY